jgi:hypothetical protein
VADAEGVPLVVGAPLGLDDADGVGSPDGDTVALNVRLPVPL